MMYEASGGKRGMNERQQIGGGSVIVSKSITRGHVNQIF